MAGMTDDGWLDVEIGTGPPGLVRVAGAIDIDTAEAFAEALAQITGDRAPQAVGISLSGVTFIDSSGMAVMIDAVNDGHSVHVGHPTEAVPWVFQASGLAGTFHVED